MSLVLDSSVTLAWIYAEETTDPVRDVLSPVEEDSAVVPTLWRLEVANGLLIAVRRGRITAKFRTEVLTNLVLLDIATDPHGDVFAWSTTLQLADRFRLTLYDAVYLELAQRRSLPLASLDKDLRAAAPLLGLTLLGTAA
ncbi:MAG: type II toxin-antitoxin system VapC family toxin [Stellaceae bacterium]